MLSCPLRVFFFFFNDTATTEIYTLSLHDALPISGMEDLVQKGQEGELGSVEALAAVGPGGIGVEEGGVDPNPTGPNRSEEHTSELQSHSDLVCRLLPGEKTNSCASKPA